MGNDVLIRVKELLDSNDVHYEHMVHGHVHTSHDAARIRGTRLEQAAKAIVLKVKRKGGDYFFIQCVLPGHRRVDLKKLKQAIGIEKASLASPEEVFSATGCTIGSVPPFGNLFGLVVYADEGLREEKEIVFSAGTHVDSIRMQLADFERVVRPLSCAFSAEIQGPAGSS